MRLAGARLKISNFVLAAVRGVLILALTVPLLHAAEPMLPIPERVSFPSADGATTLVGYLFRPEGPHAARTPAMVMMHGRAGAYSSLANGNYGAATLSRRHEQWGHLWAQHGYSALLVDGFGPRGYPAGFPRFSYDQRPETLNEVTVRPFDAYGALSWLRKRPDILADRIALQGWSNGASATLATMAMTDAPGIGKLTPSAGFRGAIAFYPACGLKGQFDDGLVPYAPVRVFHGTADEEVSPRRCGELVDKSRARNGDIQITFYPGATHDFDDPGESRQSVPANAAAKDQATASAAAFIGSLLDIRR
jgi:dienelactone hydrolase